MKFFELGLDEPGLRADLDAGYRRVMDRGWAILGPELEAFEAEFAAYCGADHAVGVGNGLDALVLALRAAGVAPGAEVIVPAHTFVATWLAVEAVGATVVPVEVDAEPYVLTAPSIAAAITQRTAAVIPVSLYGHPVDMDPILDLAARHGFFVLEDAAQSHGALSHGRRTGGLAHATAFSFYPTKNLGAVGDAGAVTTSDADLAEKIRMLRNYGSRRKYVHETAGVNSRLDELQAAFLRARLARLDEANDRRRERAARYTAQLQGANAVRTPTEAAWARHVYHLYVVRTPEREALQARLTAQGIETLIHYPTACHLQPAFAHLGYGPGAFPIAEQLAAEVLSLPLWPGMPLDDVDRVAAAILT
ncbi:MAG: DegT/DnrJ/EryC1/StrS family aminotransferase [Alphaproteobacteria bacterium]|nr:DegT/DnrJ/EryC1/StrS family aminotransferase [Alphaproteobacteria bacterium]MBU1514499.1 DegT/DnrJ/EryC1/StrS family aminotransferase [Alphaproteobacteria bacterium]MBU2096869.1 DegT/DnrJ/EryC1/StrS family aminotransferase [Alphaproteobacteria bacterium]MBU2153496.1 DegT/DnrJ/EryC1/StrS family aminotransferase [Alphaproteobacteria bacterium]MBU2305999.1 DegT/DnrJ/EryC1/StrS family aminotransferase [Alphaproteobacteria bacterium]